MRKKNLIIDWLTSNLAYGLLSMFLAIMAWAFVNGGRQTEQKRIVRIQYLQPTRGLAFHRTPLKEFKVDLSGSLFRLRMIKDEDLVYAVDLSASGPGAQRVDIDVDSLRLPMDVEALHPSPRSFNIYLEDLSTITVPLKPVTLGAPKEGFVVGEIRLTPSMVNIAGPRSLVSKINQLEVEIPLGDRDANFTTALKPRVSLPDVEVQDTVVGDVEIRPIRVTREFANIPVIPDGHAQSARVTPSTARILIEGVSNSALNLEGKLKVVVSTEDLKRGRYLLRGQIDLPAGTRLLRMEPMTFLVEIGR
jgi:YbbR domain-containing protein